MSHICSGLWSQSLSLSAVLDCGDWLELGRPLAHLSSLLDNKNNEDDCSALTVQEGEEQEPNTKKN